MPFKVALAVALTAVLTASTALAAPTSSPSSSSSSHATTQASTHKLAHKPSKSRPASTKVAAVGKRKHTVDNKPDGHGVAIAMSKPIDAPKVDPKKVDTKKADKKAPGKKREARRAEAKKSPAKGSNDKQAVPVVAAAISVPLPPLPADKPAREPLMVGRLKKGPKPPCLNAPVDVVRGTEEEHLALTKCDGSPAPLALEQMSVMLRPGGAARPTDAADHLAKAKGPELAPGVPRIDPHLLERLGILTEHFAKAGATTKLFVISGSRPSSAGSYHASGRAMDFRIDGVKNEDVVAFCKTLDDTGCGYYPNSSFVHMDVRDPETGHVAWIDASGPGETPRYVSQWPEPAPATLDKKDTRAMIEDLLSTLEKELPAMPKDDHPADPQSLPAPVVLERPEIERDLP